MSAGEAKRARSSAESANVAIYVPDVCVVNVMSYMDILDIVPLASVSVAWRAAAAKALQALQADLINGGRREVWFGRDNWRTEISTRRKDMCVAEVAHAVAFPTHSLAPAPVCGVDLSARTTRAGRTFQYHITSDSSMDVLGGMPVNNLVLSGPRSATVIAKASKVMVKTKGKGAAAQGSGDGAGGGCSTTTTGKTAKRMRTAKVQVKGTSVFRGITIEGDIVVVAGHLTMLRCCLCGTVTTRPGATLTMIECNVVGDKYAQITLGKNSSAFIYCCMLTHADTSIKALQDFRLLVVEACEFKDVNFGVEVMPSPAGSFTARNCAFTDVIKALTIGSASLHLIERISIIRTRPNFNCGALLVGSTVSSPLCIGNIKFVEHAPAEGRAAIESFFHCCSDENEIIVQNSRAGFSLDWDICQVNAGSQVFRSEYDWRMSKIEADEHY